MFLKANINAGTTEPFYRIEITPIIAHNMECHPKPNLWMGLLHLVNTRMRPTSLNVSLNNMWLVDLFGVSYTTKNNGLINTGTNLRQQALMLAL